VLTLNVGRNFGKGQTSFLIIGKGGNSVSASAKLKLMPSPGARSALQIPPRPGCTIT